MSRMLARTLSRTCQSTVVLARSFSVNSTASFLSVSSPICSQHFRPFRQGVVKGDFVGTQTEVLVPLERGLEVLRHRDQLFDDLGCFDGAVVILPQRFEQAVAVFLFLHEVRAAVRADFVLEQALQQLDREILQRRLAHVFEELVAEQADVRLFQSRQREDVVHAFGLDRVVEDLLERGVLFVLGELLADAAVLHERGADRGEKRDFGSQLRRFVQRAAERIRLRHRRHHVEEALLRRRRGRGCGSRPGRAVPTASSRTPQ